MKTQTETPLMLVHPSSVRVNTFGKMTSFNDVAMPKQTYLSMVGIQVSGTHSSGTYTTEVLGTNSHCRICCLST